MTSPTPSAPDPGASAPVSSSGAAPASAAPAALSETEASALQLALRTENAAIWTYALVAANTPDDAAVVADMRAGHLVRRDSTAEQLTLGGAPPSPPAAAYQLPAVARTPRALAVAIEQDCAAAWRSVIAATDRADLRGFAASGLSDAAVRTVQWRVLAGAGIVSVPFPGTAD